MVCLLCKELWVQREPDDCFSNLLKLLQAHYQGNLRFKGRLQMLIISQIIFLKIVWNSAN